MDDGKYTPMEPFEKAVISEGTGLKEIKDWIGYIKGLPTIEDELKKLVRSVTSNDAEYSKVLAEEMKKLSNMHDENNPVPGIVYPVGLLTTTGVVTKNLTTSFNS